MFVRLTGCQSCFANTFMLGITHFFILAMLIGTTFTELDRAWGSQGQHKAKPLGFIFSHTFQLIRMKIDVGMMVDAIKFYILILVLLTLTLNQGYRNARKQELVRQLYQFFSCFG